MARVLLFVSTLSLALVASAAQPAQGARAQGCPGAERWADACAHAHDLDVEVVLCPPGGVILSARVGAGTPVRIEIAHQPEAAFRRVGALGVSPVGEYPDWNRAPEAVRDGFERVLACVEEDPSLDVPEGRLEPAGSGGGRRADSRSPPGPPWLGLLGLMLGAVLVARIGKAARPSRRTARRAARHAALLAVLSIATFAARAALVPFAYVHQNGQGPLWIAYALGRPSAYGPGYREVLGAIARFADDPDRAVFVAHAVALALAPALSFVLARLVGARRPLAWTVALAVAVDPGLARLAGSESYFATMSALLLAAGVFLAVGVARGRVRDVHFALGVVAAGLLAAQAARVHPLGAVGAAALPLIAFAGSGSIRGRLRVTAAATATIGALALGGWLLGVGDLGGGELGDAWLPTLGARIDWGLVKRVATWGVVLGAALVYLSDQRRRALARVLTLVLVLVAAAMTDVLGPVPSIVHFGHAMLFAAPVLALFAAAAARTSLPSPLPGSPRAVAVVVAAIALAAVPFRMAVATRLPTDVRELTHLLAWRHEIPPDATVAFVGIADRRRLFVPFYGELVDGSPSAHALDVAHTPPNLASLGATVLYYRSSVCEAPETRAYCEDIERTYRLRPIERATLPALPSMGGLGYAHRDLEVALFAVEERR